MSQQGQFSLLNKRRFLPYFLTQALGAFNDNLYKNALLLLITFGGISAQSDSALLTNLAAGLFILPFFLFSPIAGQIADKLEKSTLIRWVKGFEVIIMALAASAMLMGNITMMMVLLFLMGMQSALFGPVKFALLPQQLKDEELVGGNALVEMGTFLAILIGTLTAGIFFDFEQGQYWIAGGIVFFAVLGFLSSQYIPRAAPNDPNLNINWNPFTEMVNTFRQARADPSVYLSIVAISWFWFIGASYLTQFPNFARDYLGGSTQVVTLLLTLFSLGVAIGSLLCEKLSGRKIELGIVPIGSIGMSIFGIDLYFSVTGIHVVDGMSAMVFIQQAENWRLMFDIAMVSAFGGLFVVPLQALIQHRSDDKNRSQIIAANNMLNAIFMVASAAIGILALVVIELTIPEYFLVLALMNIVVAAYVYSRVPEFVLRFFIWMLEHTFYRVQHKGLDNIPETGAVVLVCNQVSLIDAMLITGTYHRPIRCVRDRNITEMKGLTTFFNMANIIPICSPKADIDVYEHAFKQIKEELDRGEIICIFLEGKLTIDGEENTFQAGIERLLKESPVPVVPMALHSMSGSLFSYKVTLTAGPLHAAETATAASLEKEVKKLLTYS